MRYQKLDMNLLVALDALLADPHVTRAAERLNVTQSAMSGSLARLREYFDDELVRQAGRRMVLTPLGKELRDPVRELLALTDRVLATKSSFDPLTSERTFTLHCTDYVWITMVSGLVARLGTEAPRIRVEYAHAVSEFIERRADFAIKADRFQLGEYPSATLFSDPMVCIAWTGNEPGCPTSVSCRRPSWARAASRLFRIGMRCGAPRIFLCVCSGRPWNSPPCRWSFYGIRIMRGMRACAGSGRCS